MGITKRVINGYVYIKVECHPHSHKNYVAEHRLVVESFIGRYLKQEETVHHINGNKRDNRIDNLFLFPNHNQHRIFENKIRQFGYTRPILKQIKERWYRYFSPIMVNQRN